MFNWDAAQQEQFVRMQMRAQQISYATTHPHADNEIVMLGVKPVGRMLVDRGERQFTFLDIALLTEHRDQGIGTWLIRNLLAEAKAAAKPIYMHVRLANRARKLYERLGFTPVSEDGMYRTMVSHPNSD